MATLLLWLSFLLSGPILPQDASKKSGSPAEPSVDQILDNYERAIGGRQAWSGLTSRVSRGTIKIVESGVSWTFEVYEVGPSKLCLMEKLPDGKELRIAFDGTVGWTINPESGTRRLNAVELADVERRATFPEEMKVREFFKEVRLKGQATVGGRDAYVLEAVPREGNPWTMYFDSKTWLRVRIDGMWHFAQRSAAAEGYYDDYRQVAGSQVKYPFRGTLKASHLTLVRSVEEVQLNVPVDPSLFTPPSFKFKIQR